MAKAKAPKKEKSPPGPDDVVRESAGSYVSGDQRFEIRQSDTSWYLVDRQQTNEFGQELMHGPFASLKAAKESLPGARDVKPLLRSTPRPKKPIPKKPPPEPPKSWIDKLPAGEAADVRHLIRDLEKKGVDDAEALVRKDRSAGQPAVAQRLLQIKLDQLVGDLPEKDRATAKRLVGRIGEIISASESSAAPLPGWALFETTSGKEPTKRRLRLG